MPESKDNLRNCGRGKISYRTAFALSIVLHGLVFLLLALLLNPIKLSNIERIPLVIDFVSAPGDEDRGLSYQVDKKIVEQYLQQNAFVPAGSYSPTALTQSNEVEVSTPDVEDASHVAESRTPSKFAQPYFASVLLPPSVKFPRIDVARPKLLPAKMPLSERDEKTLLKQVTKLAEKFIEKDLQDTTLIFENSGQKFKIQIQHLTAKSATGLDELQFEITTERYGKILATQVRMRQLAFSNFAQLVDYWDPQVAVHDDVFEGRFHTNYAFAISRNKGVGPQFLGKVTTAACDVKTSGDFPIIDHNSIFIGGIETGVKQIRLPKTFAPFANYSTLNSDQVHVFREESWITFKKDGSFTVQSKTLPPVEHRRKNPVATYFIIGNSRAKLHVKGTVNGKVLVYSTENIIIDDDLFYAHPPDKFPHSDDFLGLVSEKNIEVAHPSVTGAGDLHIYAAIYARGWFRIPNLYSGGEATLHIYGSLSAGSLTATEPRYATHIRFDERLETQRPPNFPVTDQYEVVDWDKTWEIKGK